VITKKVSLGLILSGVFFATIACGQAYKCRNANGQFIYTDSPCTLGSKTEKVISFAAVSPVVVSTPEDAPSSTPKSLSTHQRNLQYLDMKIDEAISGRDFRQAKQLALTPEHWRKIKEAEESGAIPIKESSVALHEQPQLQQQEMQGQLQVQQQQPQTMQQEVKKAQQLQEAQRQQQIMQQKVAQAQQQQAIVQAQQQQQNEMQVYRQQQQQESQKLGQELNAYMQSPSVARAIQGAGTSGASMQNLLINNKINQLNQTAKGGASIQRR
jgi:hypothetical protein